MKFSNISTKDWESLSAYLDNEMTPWERSRLEERLASNGELKAALEEILQTKTVLRRTPQLRSPRNFTLSLDMVSSRQPNRFYPAFRLVFALASILFVITFTGDLMGIESLISRQTEQLSQSVQVVDTVVVEKEMEVFLESEADAETAVEEPMVVEEASAEEPVVEEMESLAQVPEAAVISDETPGPSEGVMDGAAETSEFQKEALPRGAEEVASPAEENEVPLALKVDVPEDTAENLALPDQGQADDIGHETEDTGVGEIPTERVDPVEEVNSPSDILLVIEMTLITVSIISLAAMVYFRRK